MKKILACILILTTLLSLSACQSIGPAEKQPLETVDIDTLLIDLGNQAKATLNVGKATTMFVIIQEIYTDYCEVRHINGEEISYVYMPIEELAQLRRGQYAAIYGVVDSVESIPYDQYFTYVFKNTSIVDMAQFDAYMVENSYDKEELVDYLGARGLYFALTAEEIPTFLAGTWETEYVQYVSGNGHPYNAQYSQEITFSTNGTYQVKYLDDDTWQADFMLGNGKYKTAEYQWTLTGDLIEIEWYERYAPHRIYKISENKFVFDERVFYRCA